MARALPTRHRAGQFRLLLGLLLPLVFLTAPGLFAQRASQVRLFRTAGSHPGNVSVSPLGSVVVKSGDGTFVTILDGYGRKDIAMPEDSFYRAYLSRSGQVWTLYREGVLLYHGEEWTRHPIVEVRRELASNPMRQLRPIGLLPAEVNHLLILLPDRLLDYDAGSRTAQVVKLASATALGEFNEIQEGASDSIWISGTYGVARIPGPGRRVTPQTEWELFPFPHTNLVVGFQRPHEFPAGTLTLSGNSPQPESPRHIVQLENREWRWFPIPGEKIRQAWHGWDRVPWGYTFNSLFRIEPGAATPLRKEPVSGAQYDMAAETNGVFWIASSEGLGRHAPHLWRSPPKLDSLEGAVHAILFEPGSTNVWLATPGGLIAARPGQVQSFPWPEEPEGSRPPRETVFRLPEGRLMAGAATVPQMFDPATRQFHPVEAPAGVRVRLLGELLDGTVCAWFENLEGTPQLDIRIFVHGAFEPLALPAVPGWEGAELIFLTETARGHLWLGTANGLIRIRLGLAGAEGVAEIHDRAQGLPRDRIVALSDVGEGRIWCGTSSRVYEFRGQRWEAKLLGIDRVTAIVPAAGSIWVGTGSGAYRYFEGSWLYHGTAQGFPEGPIHCLRVAPEGQLWAGAARGVFAFSPEADLDPPRALPPEVFAPQTPSTSEATTLRFRGFDRWDYSPPSDLLFSYRLDEGDWTPYSNINSRVFQNLSSGNHVVELLAMDRNGNRSKNSSRVEFAVIVPWFQDPRLVAVSILALCIILTLAGLAVRKHLDLKQSYSRVEKIVAQRTHELEQANRELLHSQKMRAIGTMAAGIAHDFNNILSIIKGSAQIIEDHPEDREKIRTRVDRIQRVVEQGSSIVQALLGLGRADEKELASCDLGRLLYETRKLLSDRFSGAVQFQIDVEPGLPAVVCASEVLQQVLLNFILNAADAMGQAGLITLSAAKITELSDHTVLEPVPAGPCVVLSVIDQGGGISPEVLPRIFEPFFTTKAFSSRRGTGLGLSMVYELAKELGYGLAVTTRTGEGSAFAILVPLEPAPPAPEQTDAG